MGSGNGKPTKGHNILACRWQLTTERGAKKMTNPRWFFPVITHNQPLDTLSNAHRGSTE